MLTHDGVLKLMDFGIARSRDEVRTLKTTPGRVMGTPAYMSPEQLTARDPDAEVGPASDVYSLCATFYELFAGVRLFRHDAETLENVRTRKVVGERPKPPKLHAGSLPWELDTILMGGLEPEPDHRYRSMRDLEGDVRNFLGHRPIEYKKPPTWRRLQLWYRRSPALAWTSTAVAALLFALTVTAATFAVFQSEANGTITKKNEQLGKTNGELTSERNHVNQLNIELEQKAGALAHSLSQEETAKTKALEAVQAKEHANTKLTEELEKARSTLCTVQLIQVGTVCHGDPDLGQQLLHDTQKCPIDLRDFAWRYYSRLCQRELGIYEGHNGVVNTAAFSPDGKLLASGGWDNTIRVWDRASNKLDTVLRDHTGHVQRLCFSQDGKTLVSVSLDGTARFWEVEGWKERARLNDIDGRIVAFTPDQRALATRDKDGKVTIWDLTTGKEKDSFKGPPGEFRSIALTADLKVLALGTGKFAFENQGHASGEVQLWDVPTAKKRAILSGHDQIVTSLAFTPDGKTLAAGGSGALGIVGGEGEVKLWNVATGEPGLPLKGRVIGSVTDLAFSADGRVLAAASLGIPFFRVSSRTMGEIKLWQVITGEEQLLIRGKANYIWGVGFAPDGKTLASANADKTVKLWRPAHHTDQESSDPSRPASQWVRCLACSPDGKLIASGSSDHTICLWDAATGSKLAVLTEHKHRVLGVAFSPDGMTLASASIDKSIKLWDIPAGAADKTKLRISYPTKSEANCVAYSPDGKTLAFGCQDGTITLWDLESDKARLVLKGHTESIQSIAFSRDGHSLASGAGEGDLDGNRPGQAKIWDVTTGKERFPLEGLPGGVFSVAFNSKGTILAAGGGNVMTPHRPGEMRLWDAVTGKELKHLRGHNEIIHAVTFTPDGGTLISGSFDNSANIKLWNVATGQERATLSGHTNGLQCLAVTPDGKTLISGSGDVTVKLWRVVPITDAGAFRAHADLINAVAFSPDNSTLASASYDHTVKLWDPATGQERATFGDQGGPVTSICWNQDGALLAAGVMAHLDKEKRRYTSGELYLWDVAKGRPRVSLTDLSSPIWSVALRGDGQQVAWGSQDGTVTVCDVSAAPERRPLKGHSGVVLAVAYSPDGRYLASASGTFDEAANHYTKGEIILWDGSTGQRLKTLTGHQGIVLSLAFGADGTLASGSTDRTVIIWNPQTGESRPPLMGHAGAVSSLALTADGKLLASGSDDGTVRLWDVASGKEKACVGNRQQKTTQVTLTSDGRLLGWTSFEKKLTISKLRDLLQQ